MSSAPGALCLRIETFQLNSYTTSPDVVAHMSTAGRGVMFSDQGVEIVFADVDLVKVEMIEYAFFV